jgi:hypothetical protein
MNTFDPETGAQIVQQEVDQGTQPTVTEEDDGIEDGELHPDSSTHYDSAKSLSAGKLYATVDDDFVEEEVEPIDPMTGKIFPPRFLETPPVMTDPNDTIELGYFMKQAQSGLNWKERYFFLDTWHHKLIYYENKDDARRASTQKPMKEWFLHPETEITTFSKPPNHTNGLLLKVEGGKELRISAKDTSMRDIALAQISKTLGDRGNMIKAEAQASRFPPAELVGCRVEVVGQGKGMVTDFHKSMVFSNNTATHTVLFEKGGARKVLLRRNQNSGMRFLLQESSISVKSGIEDSSKRTHSALTQSLRDQSRQNAAVVSQVP